MFHWCGKPVLRKLVWGSIEEGVWMTSLADLRCDRQTVHSLLDVCDRSLQLVGALGADGDGAISAEDSVLGREVGLLPPPY
jgi:hypothetical protein